MALVSESEAREILGARINDLWSIVNGGWEDYEKYYSMKVRLLHCPVTRASIVHDHQVARAAAYAMKAQAFGAKIIDLSKLKILLLDDLFAIRFKKLDAKKFSFNQPTHQVINFRSQNSLDGFPVTYNLEAGYVLTKDESGISEVSLVCPNGNKNKPYWDMRLEQTGSKTIFTDIFDDQNEPFDSDDEVEITPKKSADVIEIKRDKNERPD